MGPEVARAKSIPGGHVTQCVHNIVEVCLYYVFTSLLQLGDERSCDKFGHDSSNTLLPVDTQHPQVSLMTLCYFLSFWKCTDNSSELYPVNFLFPLDKLSLL
ncbi:hypothetical protein AVEN_234631-1 [Araneus ventricosus]|uniref:Uncharacterized protein n=1 Tax=Araneus ventricosus TaxID=182803 RepID=A0A4Y2SBR5_ARAVE|nr:hypothetical protein AVEN_234631-1 [Araneus ventricosus]